MSFDQEYLTNLYIELNAEHFNSELPNDLPVTWNSRLRTTAGYCHYKWREDQSKRIGNKLIDAKAITMNPRLLTTVEKIVDTLIHEMVHAWLAHTTGRDDGHNWRFQRKMDQLAGYKRSHTYHDYDTSKLKEKRLIEEHCKDHGIVGRRARMPRSYNLHRYHCKKCGCQIEFVDKRVKSPAARRKSTAVRISVKLFNRG
jgi:predicted SprT family Zn-dependent metalloprotease